MGSFDPGTELGPRLRQVREQRGLSVRELARRTQCSPSLVSQIERGLSAPSVGMLYALATELRTSLDFLFSAGAPAGGLTVTAHGDGQLRQAAPAAALPGGHCVVQRAGARRTIDLASGREYGLITSGTLHATVGFDTFELGPGDSIAFDSAVPHLYWNDTTADVRAIWAVVHPQPGLA